MTDRTFPQLRNGYYRYVRTTKNKIFWAMPGSWMFHSDLANKAKGHGRVLSAGFFEVREGVVTMPLDVDTIDSEDKSNRSVGLDLEPIMVGSASMPDDITLIHQTLHEDTV